MRGKEGEGERGRRRWKRRRRQGGSNGRGEGKREMWKRKERRQERSP